jgi:hypothetical protein
MEIASVQVLRLLGQAMKKAANIGVDSKSASLKPGKIPFDPLILHS